MGAGMGFSYALGMPGPVIAVLLLIVWLFDALTRWSDRSAQQAMRNCARAEGRIEGEEELAKRWREREQSAYSDAEGQGDG